MFVWQISQSFFLKDSCANFSSLWISLFLLLRDAFGYLSMFFIAICDEQKDIPCRDKKEETIAQESWVCCFFLSILLQVTNIERT
jgi:hypothetical protein